jgi:hypothetical protein
MKAKRCTKNTSRTYLKLEAYDVECVWNMMAHAQKPDFVFRLNGRVHLNRLGASVRSTAGSRGVRISGSNTGYTMFRDSVKSTGYTLHSPVSLSLTLPCVTVCHLFSNALYQLFFNPHVYICPKICRFVLRTFSPHITKFFSKWT